MVAACNPSKNNFRYDKGKKMISKNIFSISDKAFALLVLYKKTHQWKADAKKIWKKRVFGEFQNTMGAWPDKTEQSKEKKNPKRRKKFTIACSGNKEGWLVEGQKLH